MAACGLPKAVFVILVMVGFVPAVAEGDLSCPPKLEAWRFFGHAEAGGEWTAQTLRIRDDIGILREVSIRFKGDDLTPEHARWFDVPSLLEPDTLLARTVGFTADELHAFCRDLSDSPIGTLRDKSRPRCLVDHRGQRMIAKTTRGMVTVTDAEPGDPGNPTPVGIGVSVGGEEVDESELECQLVEKLEISSDPRQLDETTPGVVDLVDSMMERMGATAGHFESGVAAVPTARNVLDLLEERDGERVPDSLPSDFHLEFSVASNPHAEALALEHILGTGDADKEVALKLIGDLENPESIETLRLELRAGVEEDRVRAVSLALRALLAADPRAARLEALPLLAEPPFVRSALGIFALTDSTVNRNLESLDPTDAEELAKAGLRTLTYLATAAPEEPIRRTASELTSR